MRVIDTTSSLLWFWQHLVFTEAALLAHPDTAALAPPFTQLLDAFQQVQAADLATRRALLQAQAKAAIGDQNVDEALRKLHSDTLSAVTQDREHPLFKSLFDSDIAATIRFALARQLEVTKRAVANLGLSVVPDGLRSHAARLTALIEAGQAVLEGKKKAAFDRAQANLDSSGWKDDVNAVRLTAYGALLGVAAKARRPKSWAEAFFMQSAERRDALDADADTDTPGGGGAPSEPTPPVTPSPA